jgi:hypothetical protein
VGVSGGGCVVEDREANVRSRPDWEFYHSGKLARKLGVPRSTVEQLVPDWVRREEISDGNGGTTLAFNCQDIYAWRGI